MSSEVPDETKNEIAEAVFAGRKIEAIKRYREATGQRLAEANEFIEELTRELREKSPDKFTSESPAAGCGSAAMYFLIVVGLVTRFATTFIG